MNNENEPPAHFRFTGNERETNSLVCLLALIIKFLLVCSIHFLVVLAQDNIYIYIYILSV